MRGTVLPVGYMPLVDAAPLIVAQEMGFAVEEGIALDLQKAPSWSSLRDMLAFGRVDAAHMLSPVPVAMAMGLGGVASQISALSVLSVNGNVIGVSNRLADKMRAAGATIDFKDAAATGRALMEAAGAGLRIGVPFPFSMHAELLYYWLSSLGYSAPQGIDIRTVPPPLMAEALGAGEIDAFCVGEPWGSIAVEKELGELILPCSAIWEFAPEKVLAVRNDWAKAEPDLTARLIRAVWHAGKWLGDPQSRTTAAELLARPEYVDVPAEVIDRALTGRLVVSPRGEERQVDRFVEFHAGAASFPWRSQAAWIGQQLAARMGVDRDQAMQTAREVFRSDLYRRALSNVTADIPGASEKVEGGIDNRQAVASQEGKLFLGPDQFFDGRIFDPYESA